MAAPLPQRLREALVPMLQDRAIEEAFSRELLIEGQTEAEPNVISASAIAVARTRIARDDVDNTYLENLRSELRSVGPRLGGRRLGAFAAAALIGRIDLVEASEGEREFYIGDSWSLRENRAAHAALANSWDSVTANPPIDKLFALLRLNDQTFIDRFGAYVDRAPQVGPALAAALARCVAAGSASGGVLRFLASQRPRSQVLREQCVRLLRGEGRSWNEVEPQLVAAELLARHFGGDPDVLRQLANILSAGLCSGATAAICDAWPDADILEAIFQDIASGKRDPSRLNTGASLKLMLTKSKPDTVARNLAHAAASMTGGIWDAIPYWLPSALKRIQNDEAVVQSMCDRLSTGPSPSEAISFASLIAKSRGLDLELKAWCRGELDRTQSQPVAVFAMDLWLGQTTTVRSRLIDLLRAGR